MSIEIGGVEYHISIGTSERYHYRLRKIFRSIIADYPNRDSELALRCAIKEKNDTMRLQSVVPSRLFIEV